MTQAQITDLLDKRELAHPYPLLLMIVVLFKFGNHAVQMLPNQARLLANMEEEHFCK